MNNKTEIIKNIYLYISKGLSLRNTYNNAKLIDKTITLNDVKNVLKNIDNKQIFNKKVDKSLIIPIISHPGSYMADITFYYQYKKNNNGYEALITIININSRKAYVYPIKNKTTKSIIESFTTFINKVKNINTIQTDEGSEWISKEFKNLLKNNNIYHKIYNKNISKNAMSNIESFNKTIRNLIDQYITTYKTNKYIDVLPKLVENYNNSIHSSINRSPNSITKKDEKDIYKKQLEKYNEVVKKIHIDNSFFIDDKVRIIKSRGPFKKGMKQRYSKTIYKIVEVIGNKFKIQSDSGKIKFVTPYMMQQVDDIIENPNINKTKTVIKQQQTKFKNQKTKNKINKVLIQDGIDNKNIIRTKTRSQKRSK